MLLKKQLLNYNEFKQCQYCKLFYRNVNNHLTCKTSCRFFKKEILNYGYYNEQINYLGQCFEKMYDVSKIDILNKIIKIKDQQHEFT